MRPNFAEFFLGRRSQLWALGAVATFALVAANVAWLFPALEELENSAYFLHRAIASDVRNQISFFLTRQESALADAADILKQKDGVESETISRLMKENQSLESVSILRQDGAEKLKNNDSFREELFRAVSQGQIYRGPALISDSSDPLITIAVPLYGDSGYSALAAEVNLKFLLDIVRGVPVGASGAVYVVDRNGYIISHTNPSLVSGRSNIIGRKLIARALAGEEADTRGSGLTYLNEKGEQMLAVALPFAPTGWAIAVDNPKTAALASSQKILSAAIISFGIEILLLLLLIWNYFNMTKAATLFYGERNQREAILNSLSDGVIEYNDKSEVILMNPKAEELLGVKFKDIVGLVVTPELPKSNYKLKGLVELMYPALATYASPTKSIPGTMAKTMEIHLSRLELKLFVTITQVIDQDGKVRGFLKILHDASREQFLGRMKSEFVSIAAHQLRTPLSAIKWVLKLLLEGDAGTLSKEQADFVSKGYEINERMIKLVNDLLSVARIEEGKFGYEFAEMNIGEFLGNAVAGYADLAKRKGINLKFEQAGEKLQLVYGDAEKLSLAVNNLLDNAMKYTPSGGAVTIKLDKAGNFAAISISDNGVGIPAEEQKRVFSKFFRASNVIKMETDGTGLGLFIVRNIIKRHGGDISFDSGVGKGTVFTFTLPVRKELVPKEEKPELEEFLGSV